MENKNKGTSGGGRLVAVAAVSLLSGAAALALGRVFTGSVPALKLVGAALASVVLAGLLQRRSLAPALGAAAGGFVVVAGILVFPETTWAGIPRVQTLARILAAIGEANTEARNRIAPAFPVAPLLTVALFAVWGASFASHALLVRASRPVLALVPPAGLAAFADSAIGPVPRPSYAILLLAGAMAVVFAGNFIRILRWGRKGESDGFRWRSSAQGAARAGAAAIGIALIAPVFIPGYGSSPVLQPETGFGSARVDPKVSLGSTLPPQSEVPLFSVTAVRPAYWRIESLDAFDGLAWSSSRDDSDGRMITTSNEPVRLGASADEELTLRQDVRIAQMESRWLPMAFEAATLRVDEGTVTYDAEAGTASASQSLPGGYRYTVVSTLHAPTARDLDLAADPTAPAARAAAGISPGVYEQYTRLPRPLPGSIEELTQRITEDQPNPYRKMIAIQDYLRENLVFDETLEEVPADRDPLVYFLTESRRGFCQQFAGAMAAMARTLGYPSRVAYGFLPGVELGNDTWQVSAAETHVWPEILFPDYGWIAFEPTPTRSNPVPSQYLQPPPYHDPSCGPRCRLQEAATAARREQQVVAQAPDRTPRRTEPDERGEMTNSPSGPRLLPIALVLLGIAAFALVAWPPARFMVRRARLAGARDDRSRILAHYRMFESKAADLGFGRLPGQTIAEHEKQLSGGLSESDRFGELVSLAAYSPQSVGRADSAEARKLTAAAARRLRERSSIAVRVRGAYRLRNSQLPVRASRAASFNARMKRSRS
ncbi:MAG: DUF3488 and transglutaminase-like domain-containing protein [Actinomycetota bacterium]